jgi:MFS family permease
MRHILQPVIFLLISFTITCIGLGVHNTLMGVRAAIEDFSPLTLSLMTSLYYTGFILGTKLTEKSISHVGHIRTYSALAAMLCAITLLHALWINEYSWIALRFWHGACVAGAYMVIESWLNGLSGKENRGRVMSVYMILNSLGLAGGQLFFSVAEGGSYTLFMISAVLSALGLVPLVLSNTRQPEQTASSAPIPIRTLFTISPLSVVGVLCIGLVNGAFFGFAAAALIKQGLEADFAAQFLGITLLGGLLMQWPLGSLSDRINRRLVVMISALGAACAAASIAYLLLDNTAPATWPLMLAGLFYGGFCYPIYALLASLLNDRIEAAMMVRASRAMLTLNGIGAIIGPALGWVAFTLFAASGIFVYIALVFMLLGSTSLLRLLFGKKLPPHLRIARFSEWFPYR